MKKLILLIICACFGNLYAQETVWLFIENGNDDAYQHYANFVGQDPVGTMFVDAESLQMGHSYDPSLFYQIGLRYQSVPIPAKSTIESAYIQFTSLEASEEQHVVWIYGERTPNPTAFTSADFNISDRECTYHSEQWGVVEWQAFIPGPDQRTHDIKALVQEIVDLDAWVQNNPMVFFFKGSSPGQGELYPKIACSWEYMGDMYAPVLTITYYEPALVEEIDAAGAMNIFPNPILNTFTISFTELQTGHYEICMYDLTGQQAYKVHEGQLDHGDHEFSLSAGELNLQPGVYFVSICGETGNMVQKIVVKD